MQFYDYSGMNDFWYPFFFPKIKEIILNFTCSDNFLELSIVPNLEKLTIGCFGDKEGLVNVNARGEDRMLKLRSLSM